MDFKSFWTSARGSATLEMALVLPMIFLSVVLVLSLSIGYYQEVNRQVDQRMDERSAVVSQGQIDRNEDQWIRRIDAISEVTDL